MTHREAPGTTQYSQGICHMTDSDPGDYNSQHMDHEVEITALLNRSIAEARLGREQIQVKQSETQAEIKALIFKIESVAEKVDHLLSLMVFFQLIVGTGMLILYLIVFYLFLK